MWICDGELEVHLCWQQHGEEQTQLTTKFAHSAVRLMLQMLLPRRMMS